MVDYRHFWLYAKRHYLWGNCLNDLKCLISERNGIEMKYITERDVLHALMEIVFPLLDYHKFVKLVGGTLDTNGNHNLFIDICLNIIGNTQVVADGHAIYDLGEPDFRILPQPKGEFNYWNPNREED